MKPAISVHNLSKQYRIGTAPIKGNNLTENLRRQARTAWDKVTRLVSPNKEFEKDESFWALKDVSFEVQPGEVVGIIGRNGAGKSTLLKILSQIVEPTSGHADIRGRMGSLLEVGTGFHPELTGRENIYLSGIIMGMSRHEIDRNFDDIVEFSGVEKFLDTPVKRYSSGMYVRLGFSIAAHLELEILIVDEVLAVGDATFQRRCVDRMAELARCGRTILFVSHNMQLIPLLCGRAVELRRGHVSHVGQAGDVTREYLKSLLNDARLLNLADKHRSGDGRARFMNVHMVNEDGEPVAQSSSGEDLILRMEIESKVQAFDVGISVILTTQHGLRLVTGWNKEVGRKVNLRIGRQVVECRFRGLTLRPGHMVLACLWLSDGEVMDWVENALSIDVSVSDRFSFLSPDMNQGPVHFDYDWRELSHK